MTEHGPEQPVAAEQTAVPREQPEPTAARAAFVEQWQKRIRKAKAHWSRDFRRILLNMEMAKLGSTGEWRRGKNYTANIIQRHINGRVATLYAKNPRVTAKRRERMDFAIWDGTQEMLQVAMETMRVNPADPNNAALIQDVVQGLQRKQMFNKIGKTLEILFHYYLDEQSQNFKHQAKQAVRRSQVTGVAYCKLGYQRILEKRPEITSQIADATNRLATIEALSADLADGVIQQEDPAAEELRIMLRDLQAQETIITREGLVFTWPKSKDVIVDTNCVQLNGFIGADWVAVEMMLSPQKVQEVWQVDVSKGVGVSTDDGGSGTIDVNTADGSGQEAGGSGKRSGKVRVWEVQDKRTGMVFVIAEGWKDFIKEPAAPDMALERFWDLFVLEFNPVEDDGDRPRIHGLSEVELIEDMQMEYNRARQGLREHRIANRPGHVTTKGKLEDDDKRSFGIRAAHDVIELNGLSPGEKIVDVLQAIPTVGIDPNLYDVTPVFDDLQRTAGTQEAELGKKKGITATESGIAEGSRASGVESNKADLDIMLTELARSGGQALLKLAGRAEVEKIVGPGSVWPEFSSQEIAEEIFLEVRAGSSGKPNQAQDIANFERMAPTLVQTPGISPSWFARKQLEMLDANIDLEEAILEGMPSILALNALAGQPTDPASVAPGQGGAPGAGPGADPAQQGGQGQFNAPQPGGPQGPQPGFPAPVV